MFTETIGDATITVECLGVDFTQGRRQLYRYTITTADWSHTAGDIRSGVGAEPDEEEAFRTLLAFLSACAESRAYAGDSENADLFPEDVGAWAEANSDEIAILGAEPD
ncbi:hypothetical protein MUG78_16970 [Gordonia alkaliphila]|uniref:hypothetical protein n=1 Tax=Gordonia alkaliphila TaxID=1053547 RepID=UPI001FF68E31|nr:hypothetical protein [Gordonia alkaliphila]MCK0441094.1 hypothetical protein [Gordonia alkaliphila]